MAVRITEPDSKATTAVSRAPCWRLFVACIFLVKSAHFALSPLGFAFFMAYSDNEASAMTDDLSPTQVSADPVLSEFELPLRRTFYPLGYPLILETNSPDVIRAAEEGWGEFERMVAE